jgi:hypothetical protein
MEAAAKRVAAEGGAAMAGLRPPFALRRMPEKARQERSANGARRLPRRGTRAGNARAKAVG